MKYPSLHPLPALSNGLDGGCSGVALLLADVVISIVSGVEVVTVVDVLDVIVD